MSKRIATNHYFRLIHGVFNKFYLKYPHRAPWNLQNKPSCGKDILYDEIIADIFVHVVSNHIENNSISQQITQDIRKLIPNHKSDFNTKSEGIILTANEIVKKHIITKTRGNSSGHRLINKDAFRRFISDFPKQYSENLDHIVSVNLPCIQLEAICLYGWDKSYEQLLQEREDIFYIQNGLIRLIEINLDVRYVEPLKAVIQGFKTSKEIIGPPIFKDLITDILVRKIGAEISTFKDGKITLPINEYLETLIDVIGKCDCGFGSNIDEFTELFTTPNGKKILEINKNQGMPIIINEKETPNPNKYRRLFFVKSGMSDSEGNLVLKSEDHDAIKLQLENNVEVLVIFENALEINGSENDRKKLDFAILKLEGFPVILTSKFEGEESEGVIFIDASKPEEHFKNYLEKILAIDKLEFIFEPRLKDGKVILGESISSNALNGINDRLKQIYLK